MKPKFYLLLLAPVLMFASCTKWVPDTNYNDLAGNWRMVSAERRTSYGVEPVHTGYENGTFYFSNNGNAEYSDNYGRMNGSWRMVQRSGGYYDYYGNWQTGGTTSLELRLYDNYNDDAIEWEFYSIEMTSGRSRMVGYMKRNGYDYRFEFRR